MIRILNVTFDDSAKKTSWTAFKKAHSENKEFLLALNAKGKDLKWAYKQLTGKDVLCKKVVKKGAESK